MGFVELAGQHATDAHGLAPRGLGTIRGRRLRASVRNACSAYSSDDCSNIPPREKMNVASRIGLRYMALQKRALRGTRGTKARPAPGQTRLLEEAEPCPLDTWKIRIFGVGFRGPLAFW